VKVLDHDEEEYQQPIEPFFSWALWWGAIILAVWALAAAVALTQ